MIEYASVYKVQNGRSEQEASSAAVIRCIIHTGNIGFTKKNYFNKIFLIL